ncbi:Fic family protein [Myxococcaceae bacterium JPH2]|nr:Fic family protein [Myxococcaceae bacterium JPH2]
MEPPDATEQLAPHLQATLALDWRLPSLRADLEAASSRPFEETGAQEDYLANFDLPAHEPVQDARGPRFHSALAQVRALADSGAPLTYARLEETQSLLMGHPVHFRQGEAFAHRGTHRYRHTPELEATFARKVEEDARDECHPVAQATRLYLDLCFFHPFPDGNARAARVWLEYLLRRARLPTPALHPLVLHPKRPGDAENYLRFARRMARAIAGPAAPCLNAC